MRVGTIVGFQNPARWRRPWTEVYDSTLDFVVRAEALGLDQVWLTEHHFAPDGYSPALLPIAGAIAARTSRIRIGTKVLLLPFHDPVRLAEDIATVDVMSGGRLDIGVAAGYRVEEFAGFGIDRGERMARTREGLEVLERALRGEPFTHAGRFWSYDGAHVVPPPVQDPVPLWVGGRSPGPLRRAAAGGRHLQLADFDPELCAADVAVYEQALRDAGRDPDAFAIAAVASVFVDEDGARARAIAGPHLRYQQDQYRRWFAAAGDRATVETAADELPPGCLVGTPEEVTARIAAARDRFRFTDFSFWMLAPGMDPAQASRSLELFAQRVLPALREL